MPRKSDTSHDQYIVEAYANGKLIKEIAEDLSKSYGFVHDRLVANEVAIRPRGGRIKVLDAWEMARTEFLYNRCQFDLVTTGQILGVHKTTVHRRLKSAGVPRRPKGKKVKPKL
jgi:transposase